MQRILSLIGYSQTISSFEILVTSGKTTENSRNRGDLPFFPLCHKLRPTRGKCEPKTQFSDIQFVHINHILVIFLIDNSNTLELIDETSFKGANSLSDSPGKRSSFSLELVKNEAQPVPIYL
jgi:hypothetical protein